MVPSFTLLPCASCLFGKHEIYDPVSFFFQFFAKFVDSAPKYRDIIATKNTISHKKGQGRMRYFCAFSCFSWPFLPEVEVSIFNRRSNKIHPVHLIRCFCRLTVPVSHYFARKIIALRWALLSPCASLTSSYIRCNHGTCFTPHRRCLPACPLPPGPGLAWPGRRGRSA